MDKNIKKYIQDVTTGYTLRYFAGDTKDNFETYLKKVKSLTFSAVQNYCKLRLKLLTNEKIMDVKAKVIEKLVNVAIAYAIKEYNIDVSSTLAEEYTAKIVPAVVDDVTQLKIEMFKSLLYIFTDIEGNNEA